MGSLDAGFGPLAINFVLATGVRDLTPNLPTDDGFLGPNPVQPFLLGDGSFNVQPVIEAADTWPNFHNNARTTIEDAVAFYTIANAGEIGDRRLEKRIRKCRAIGFKKRVRIRSPRFHRVDHESVEHEIRIQACILANPPGRLLDHLHTFGAISLTLSDHNVSIRNRQRRLQPEATGGRRVDGTTSNACSFAPSSQRSPLRSTSRKRSAALFQSRISGSQLVSPRVPGTT